MLLELWVGSGFSKSVCMYITGKANHMRSASALFVYPKLLKHIYSKFWGLVFAYKKILEKRKKNKKIGTKK